jgi:hypothetical protein
MSSHISLSVNCVLYIPCISLGGAPCIKLENKTLLCLIVEKLHVFVINHQKGEIESASRPPSGFWRIDDQ